MRLAKLQESSQLCNIEADNDVAIDQRRWRCHIAEFLSSGSAVSTPAMFRSVKETGRTSEEAGSTLLQARALYQGQIWPRAGWSVDREDFVPQERLCASQFSDYRRAPDRPA